MLSPTSFFKIRKEELTRVVGISPYYSSWEDVPFPDSFYETDKDPIYEDPDFF